MGGDHERARVERHPQRELVRGRVERPLLVDELAVEHVEVDVGEHRLDQRGAASEAPLHLGERVPPVRPRCDLLREHGLDELAPGRRLRQVDRERERVEEEPANPVPALPLGPPVRDEPGQEASRAGLLRQRGEVSGVEHALERDLGGARDLPQRRLEVVERDESLVVCVGAGLRPPLAREPERRVCIDALAPELRVVLRVERLALERDEVDEADLRRLVGRRIRACTAGAVHVQELGDERVVAPAVEDRMALAEREPPGVVRDEVGEEAVERRPLEVERPGALGGDELVHARLLLGLVEVTEILEADLGLGGRMDELERLREAGEVERRAQDLVPVADDPGRLAEGVE